MLHSRTMFCPQCKAEYRPGFTRCADCDLDLVDRLPTVAHPAPHSHDAAWSREPDDVDWRNERKEVVWSTDSQPDCIRWCEDFRLAGIPYRVNQSRNQLWGAHRLEEHYEIIVPGHFFDKAKARIEKKLGWYPDPNEPESSSIVENDYAGFSDDPSAPLETEPRDFKPWFAEDATVEVFSEPIGSAREEDESQANMIEMSLRENLIQSRAEDSNSSRKVFVLPEDEPRAREIIREITTGSPST